MDKFLHRKESCLQNFYSQIFLVYYLQACVNNYKHVWDLHGNIVNVRPAAFKSILFLFYHGVCSVLLSTDPRILVVVGTEICGDIVVNAVMEIKLKYINRQITNTSIFHNTQ